MQKPRYAERSLPQLLKAKAEQDVAIIIIRLGSSIPPRNILPEATVILTALPNKKWRSVVSIKDENRSSWKGNGEYKAAPSMIRSTFSQRQPGCILKCRPHRIWRKIPEKEIQISQLTAERWWTNENIYRPHSFAAVVVISLFFLLFREFPNETKPCAAAAHSCELENVQKQLAANRIGAERRKNRNAPVWQKDPVRSRLGGMSRNKNTLWIICQETWWMTPENAQAFGTRAGYGREPSWKCAAWYIIWCPKRWWSSTIPPCVILQRYQPKQVLQVKHQSINLGEHHFDQTTPSPFTGGAGTITTSLNMHRPNRPLHSWAWPQPPAGNRGRWWYGFWYSHTSRSVVLADQYPEPRGVLNRKPISARPKARHIRIDRTGYINVQRPYAAQPYK